MANSPFKMKNALGSDMTGKSNQASAGTQPAAGNQMFQGTVPGGVQRPYWQTTQAPAKPATYGMNQQATSVPTPTIDAMKRKLEGDANTVIQSGIDEMMGDLGQYSAIDQFGGKGGQQQGQYANQQSQYVTDLLKNLLGQLGQTDWQGQQQQGLDALAKQQAMSMYQLAQQQASRGLGGGGSYLGGADQRIAATQDATGKFMLDLQKQQAAEKNAIAQLQAAIGGQVGEMGMQDAAFGYQQTLGEQERLFAYLQALANMQQAGVDFFPWQGEQDDLATLMKQLYSGGNANG
jgi:hypothetical protein